MRSDFTDSTHVASSLYAGARSVTGGAPADVIRSVTSMESRRRAYFWRARNATRLMARYVMFRTTKYTRTT